MLRDPRWPRFASALRALGGAARAALSAGLLAALAACTLPEPPGGRPQRPITTPLLAVSPAPTLDAGATATVLSRPITPTRAPTPPPTAAPTEGPTAAPDGPAAYVVEPGDTLASIADEFDTTVDEIVAFNELADPNRIEVGQQILIPPAAP